MEINLLEQLLPLSPLIAMLVAGIIYFYKENKNLHKENKELNAYIRENDKKNTQILAGVSNTLDKVLTDNEKNIEHIKEHISLVLLKNKSKE
jgi:phosphate/sulfate permease